MSTTVTLPDGRTVPTLGQGTWYLGESPSRSTCSEAADRACAEGRA